MKKVLIFIMCFLVAVSHLDAECDYSKLRSLNELSSYVNYTYEYVDESAHFYIKLLNVVDELKIEYDNMIQETKEKAVTINNLEPGDSIKIYVYSNELTGCVDEALRIINISLPYLNQYYNTDLCKGHEDLQICNSKFLSYKLSYSAFQNILDKQLRAQEELNEPENPSTDEEKEVGLIDILFNIVKKYWIPVLLILVASGISLLIWNLVYRRIKYRF